MVQSMIKNAEQELINKSQLLSDLNHKGFIVLNDIYSQEFLRKVQNIIKEPMNQPTINGRRGYVRKNYTKFLYSTLSWGKEIINLYTNPKIIDLVEAYTEDPVHISNYRIYTTLPSKIDAMHWHVDNKIDVYDKDTQKITHQLNAHDKGIIMVMYLVDVEDGGFQIVEGSHLWSTKENKESWNDRENEFQDKIHTFNHKPAGTIIIYDYRCIHRAKPYSGGQVRTSLFCQYSPSFIPVGEPIFLNTRDMAELTEQQKQLLNVGKEPTALNWPLGEPGEIIEDLGFKAITGFFKMKAKKIAKMLGVGRR